MLGNGQNVVFVVERAIGALVVADDDLGMLLAREHRRLFAALGVPHPAQHLVRHDEVRLDATAAK